MIKRLIIGLLLFAAAILNAQDYYYVTDGYGHVLAFRTYDMIYRPTDYVPPVTYGPISGALAWYPLNGNFEDSLGYHDGTMGGTITFPDDTSAYFPGGGDDYWDCGFVIPDGCDTITISYLANYVTDDNSIYTEFSTVEKYVPDTAGFFSAIDGTGTGFYNWTPRVQDENGNTSYGTTVGSSISSTTPDNTWVHVMQVWRKDSEGQFTWLIWVDGVYAFTNGGGDSILSEDGQLYGSNFRFGAPHSASTGLVNTYVDNVMIFRGDLRYHPDGNYLDTIIANPYTMPMIGGEQPPEPPTGVEYDLAHTLWVKVPEGLTTNDRVLELTANRNYTPVNGWNWEIVTGSTDFTISDTILYATTDLTPGVYQIHCTVFDNVAWDTASIWVTVTGDANNIYCDLDAVSDGNGTIGSPHNYPIVQEGKYTYLKRGTSYTYNAQWSISSTDNWLIGAYGSGARPEIQLNYRVSSQGNFHISSCDNITVRDVELYNTQTVAPSITVMTTGVMNDVVFDNCEIHGYVGGLAVNDTSAMQLLRLGGATSSQITDGAIRNCIMYDSYDDAIYTFALRGSGISSRFMWEGNWIHTVNLLGVALGGGGDPIQFDSDEAGADTRFNHFRYNHLSRRNNIGKHCLLYECDGSLLTSSGTNTIIEKNRFDGTHLDSDSYGQNCLTLSSARGTIVRFNWMDGATRGIALWSESPYDTDPYNHYIEIYGNLITRSQRYGIHVHDAGADYLEIFNNTIADYEELGISMVAGNSGSQAKNNIFTWTGSYGSISAISGTISTEDYNLFFPNAGLYSGSEGAHSLDGYNPLFSTGLDSDYEIGNLSPAYHAGTDVGLNKDKWGVNWGVSPSMGYKEYSGSGITPSPQWPLTITTGEYLADGYGNPFLMNGDTPWSLISGPDYNGVVQYLDDRESKGVNALMVLLVDAYDPGPANANGDLPFPTGQEFQTMNEDYFKFADTVMNEIYSRDMAVLLFPAYLGWNGGSEGWYSDIIGTPLQDMYDYGVYCGNRYKDYDNIIWCVGGDYEPNNAIEEIRAMVDGIQSVDTDAEVWTAHNGRYTSGFEAYDEQDKEWMNLNSTYADGNSMTWYLREDYNRDTAFFMIEGRYENMGDWTPQMMRAQMYWSIFGGATGQFFGNDPIYDFGTGWQSELTSEGSQDLGRCATFTDTIDWWNGTPDWTHNVMTLGYGSLGTSTYATTLRIDDGSAIYAYIPSSRTVTIDMTKITATYGADCWWVNPSTLGISWIGNYSTSIDHSFIPPTSRDYILMIRANNNASPTYYQDDFDSYTDNYDLNIATNWAQEYGDIRVQVVAGDGEVFPANTNDECSSYYTTSVGTEQFIQGTVAALSAGDAMGLSGRNSGGSGSYYSYYSTPTVSYLGRMNLGTWTLLATGDPWTVNDVVRMEITGTGATVTLKVYVNGTLDTSLDTDGIYEDTSASRLTTGNYIGLAGFDYTTTSRLDDWSGGAL